MPKYINADETKSAIDFFMCKQSVYTTGEIKNFIDKMPEAVVRCKDCKHYFIGNCMNTDVPIYADNGAEFMPDSDFYCAYAERRKSE